MNADELKPMVTPEWTAQLLQVNANLTDQLQRIREYVSDNPGSIDADTILQMIDIE